MPILRTKRLKLLAFLLTLSAPQIVAQADRGVITGLVIDPQGAPVANAVVSVKDLKTGVVTKLTTTDSGNYSTPPLIIGTYEVSVAMQGFKAFRATDINLASGQTFRQDVALQVGEMQQAVEVSGQIEQLNADNPQMSASVNQIEYESLPAILGSGENRVPEAQLYTFPTFVAPTQGNIYPGSAFGARINGGQRSAFENFLDGASYGEASAHNGTQERSAPYESIAEARVIDNTFSAQYGHTNTSASTAANESFRVVRRAGYAEALRGISFTPGTNTTPPAQIPYPVTRSRPVYNLIAGTYTQNITVLNNITTTLTGPVYLELQNLTYRLKYGTFVNGIPAIQLVARGATWNPGASVTVTATFERPFNGFLRYDPVVTQ